MAGAITSLMTGTSYKRSAELAGVVGPYTGYARNADAHKRVMRKHQAANDAVRSVNSVDRDVHVLAGQAWDAVIKTGEKNGFRNAQASVLAPTGTIGFMMDCDTTGIEPDFSLVKFKKLVGGGSMQIVNQTVPRALKKLGYQQEQIEAIVEYIAEHGHVIDAPSLKQEHYEVFDCAMGARALKPMGHVRMMAAAQPFLSGAISKTVNLPEEATVEEIEDVYLQSWKLGLKATAIYRDNCKVGQPLSDGKSKKKDEPAAVEVGRAVTPMPNPVRKRLPKKRPSQTTSFTVGGAEGYMTAGSYPDDGLGEVFLKLGKIPCRWDDAFSMAITCLQAAGLTDDPDVRIERVDHGLHYSALEALRDGYLHRRGASASTSRRARTRPRLQMMVTAASLVDDVRAGRPAGRRRPARRRCHRRPRAPRRPRTSPSRADADAPRRCRCPSRSASRTAGSPAPAGGRCSP